MTLASTGSAALVSPSSGVPSDNQTGSATAGGTAHVHGMANHTHSIGHSHPSVSVSGSANIGQAAVRIDVSTAGTVTPTGVGMLFAYAGVIGVIFQLPVTQASARFSGFATVLCSGAIEALAFVFLLPAPALPLLIAAITFASFRPHSC